MKQALLFLLFCLPCCYALQFEGANGTGVAQLAIRIRYTAMILGLIFAAFGIGLLISINHKLKLMLDEIRKRPTS